MSILFIYLDKLYIDGVWQVVGNYEVIFNLVSEVVIGQVLVGDLVSVEVVICVV